MRQGRAWKSSVLANDWREHVNHGETTILKSPKSDFQRFESQHEHWPAARLKTYITL